MVKFKERIEPSEVNKYLEEKHPSQRHQQVLRHWTRASQQVQDTAEASLKEIK